MKSMFGASPKPSEEQKKFKDGEIAFSLYSKETMSFGCWFFVYLSVIPFLFIFFYHAFPTTVLGIVGIFAMTSFVPFLLNRGDKVVSEPVGPLLAASMCACTAIVFLGSMYMYWAHVQPMRALILTREYNNVYPQLASAAFTDAAFVTFTGNTSVDVTKAVRTKSLDSGLDTFCVAPIVNEANTGRVEFWAIGVNCCGKKEGDKFECGDVGKAGAFGAKSGHVMQNPNDLLFDSIGKYIAPPIVRRDIFLEAIKKAEHTKGLVASEDPLLVLWTHEKKDDVIAHKMIKIVVQAVLVNGLVSGIMAVFLTRILHRFSYLRHLNRTEKYGEQNQDQDVSARLREFMSVMEDNFENHELLVHVRRQKLSPADMCVMGIIVPYVTMMLCVILTTYTGCLRNGHYVYAPFYIMLSLGIFALMLTPNRVVNAMFLMLVSLIGLYIGFENYYSNMFHYCSVDSRRSYTKVPADGSSNVYWDAGIMKFNDQAYLSQTHSVGFLYKDVVYCVAPILSRGNDCSNTSHISMVQKSTFMVPSEPAMPLSFLQRTGRMHYNLDTDLDTEDTEAAELPPTVPPVAQCHGGAPPRVEFWAVGMNCCGARQDFNCDGGKELNAHTGILVRETGFEEPGGVRDQFHNAIDQAVGAYGLPEPERPVLIRWGKDAAAMQNDWATRAGGVILLTAMVGLLSILLIGIGSWFYMKKMRKRELQQQREAGETAEEVDGGGAEQFTGGFFGSGQDQGRSQLRV